MYTPTIKSEFWADSPSILAYSRSQGLDEAQLLPQLPRFSVDAHEVLDTVLKECKPRIRAKSLHVSVRLLSRQYHISDDGERLRHMYLSLLNSAIAKAKPGSNLTLRAYCPSDCALRVEIEEHSAWRSKLPASPLALQGKKVLPIRGHR